MNLTLTHIQHYPIGGENALKVKSNYWKNVGDCDIVVIANEEDNNFGNNIGIRANDGIGMHTSLDDIKLLLRPMSDLYKEIDGKIGIVDIFKMTNIRIESYSVTESSLAYDDGAEYCGFWWEDDNKCFSNSDCEMFFTMEMMEYLFANHYDVFDLIGQNLAINKNTVK